MVRNRKLSTDKDFDEAMKRNTRIRVFRDDQIVDSGGVVIRFDDSTVVIQSGVSEVAYHPRDKCEFFEMPDRPINQTTSTS